MNSFQSPSPNDQRRFSTTELAIGVNPAELSAPSPDAAPQPAPVNQTTLVPSEKTLELMRQLEALAHEVAIVSRGDSSKQRIKVQEGSNSAGLQPVEPSIRVSPRDHLASDSQSFGARTNLTPVGFFMAARDWLASHGPSFGRPSATLASLFIAVRDWLAIYRPSFGRPSATLAGSFIAARDWLKRHGPSVGRRTSTTLAGSFIAARDWLKRHGPSVGKRTSATLASFFVVILIGVATALVWQSQRASTAKSPNDVAVAEEQSGFTPVRQLQDASPQIASATQTAPESTARATLVQQLEGMTRDLVVLRRRVEELAAKQEHLVDAQEQLATRQEQMAQTIAKPQAVKRNVNQKTSSPPRTNVFPETAAEASFLPRPRPPLSVLDRR